MKIAIPVRWITAATVVGGFTIASTNLLAQNNAAKNAGGGSGRVACVDVVKALNEYQRQKDLDDEFSQKGQALNNENIRRRGEIDQMQKTVDSLNVDTDPTYNEKAHTLLSMQIAYKNWFDATQADMARETGVWRMRLYKDLLEAVKNVAAKQGYDLVLYKDEFEAKSFEPETIANLIRGRKVLFAANTNDITQAVTDALNETYRAQPRKPMLQVSVPTGAPPASPAPAPAPAPAQNPPGKKPQ